MEFRYGRGRLGVAELQEEIDQFGMALLADAQLRMNAEKHGLGPEQIDAIEKSPSSVFRVDSEGAGLDPVSTAIIITIGTSVAEKAVGSFWSDVVLPWIRKRRGDDAVESHH